MVGAPQRILSQVTNCPSIGPIIASLLTITLKLNRNTTSLVIFHRIMACSIQSPSRKISAEKE